MNPRSSSAEISRCTPDLDFRSSASRISSKLGLMPSSFRRLSMNSNSSRCLAVSIGLYSPCRTNRERVGNKATAVKSRGLAARVDHARLLGLDRRFVALALQLFADRGEELLRVIIRHFGLQLRLHL